MKRNKVFQRPTFILSCIALFLLPYTIHAGCDKPSQLKAEATGQQVTFKWSGKGTSYLIEVENTSTDVHVVPEQKVSSPFVQTLPNGKYKFKIRTLCTGDKSSWSDWVSFVVGNVATPSTPPSGSSGGAGSSSGSGSSGDGDKKKDTCLVPTLLMASVSGNKIKFSWTGSASEFQIEVENKKTDVDVISEQLVSNPFVTTLPNGTYKFKVRSVCGGNHSDWSSSTTFVIGSDTTSSSDGKKDDKGSKGSRDTCKAPTQLMTSISGNEVTLSWTGSATRFQMELENKSTDKKIIDEQMVSNPFMITLPDGKYKFKVRSVCDSSDHSKWSAAENFKLGIDTASSGGSDDDEDDDGDDEDDGDDDDDDKDSTNMRDTCKAPTQLMASVSGNEVKLSWTGSATQFQMELENKSTDQDIIDEQIVTNPFTITLADGKYKFKVRSVCDSSDHSKWSESENFKIGIDTASSGSDDDDDGRDSTDNRDTCKAPTQLMASVNGNEVKLSWTGSAPQFQMELENKKTDKDIIDEQIVSNPFMITLPAGNYKFKVRSLCDSSDHGDWSKDVSFKVGSDSVTTVNPPTSNNNSAGTAKLQCAMPTSAVVNPLSNSSVTLSWIAASNVKRYQLEVESQENTPAFNQKLTVSSTSAIIQGLIVGGIYKFKVRSLCTSSNSNYTLPILYTVPMNLTQNKNLERRANSLAIQMDIYPNPTVSNLTLQIANPGNRKGTIQILNIDGQVKSEWQNISLTHSMPIDISSLNTGLYYVRIWSNDAQVIKKLIVQ